MQTALGERGFERHQPGHPMALAVAIDKPLAQHHVAAAFTIDHAASCRRDAQAV